MKNHRVKNYLFVILLAFMAVTFIYRHARSQNSVTAPTTFQTPTPPASLKVLASQYGSYVAYAGPSTAPTYPDLATVTQLSTDIITCTVLSNHTSLTPDGTFITTDYLVRVDSTLKGRLAAGTTLTVSLPGGLVAFNSSNATNLPPLAITLPPANGAIATASPPSLPSGITYAEIRTPWFKKMRNGGQYYLFLTGVGSLNRTYNIKTYETTGGPQGVFEIINGVVKSNSGRLRDPMWQYHNMAVADFNTTTLNIIASQPPSPNPPL